MGVAAENRYKALVRRQLDDQEAERRQREDAACALEVAEECNAFVRQVNGFVADPGGLRLPTVERMKKRRGWPARLEALRLAHVEWLEARPSRAMAYHAICVKRAQAAYAVLMFLLDDCWTIPNHISVPRAAVV
jgi:hypothetical protein